MGDYIKEMKDMYNRAKTRIRKVGDMSLKVEFPSFYWISCQREAVGNRCPRGEAEVTFWDLRFRRAIQDWEVNEFERMLQLLRQHCEAVDRTNSIRWRLGNDGVFPIQSSVRSFY